MLVFISNTSLIAQSWVEKMQDPNANFYAIKADFESYWQTHDRTEKGKGYKAFKRWENFVERRVYPSGNLSQLTLTAKNYETFLKKYTEQIPVNGRGIGGANLIASSTWTPIGPMGAINGNAGGQLLKSGRLNFITITPGNANTLWIGAPAGGLWKSTNGGTSWSTNTDFLSVIGCSDLAIDPTNTLVMYLATGDGEAGDTRSIGVLKTTNGGNTWSATGLSSAVTSNFLIRRLLINPNNTQIVLAATSSGIYRTTNGGTNWTQVTTNSTYDMEFKPSHPNVVYASGTSFRMSSDGGVTWTQISNGIPTTGVNRMAIAVTPADSNYVYVLASSSTNSGFQGFYKSVVGGTVFTQITTTLNLLGYASAGNDTGGQGWYTLCIAASPLDRDEVVTGGVNIWRTTNSGTAWTLFGHWVANGAPFTHADQHDLEYDAAGNLFCTNDGTVYKRTGNTWTEISGSINISQIYRIGMSSLTANKWITGHQDNGTAIWNGFSYNAALGGDGMDCFYDRTNDQNVFGEYQNGGMQRSTNGGTSWSGASTGITGTAPWVTIWKQDPSVSTRLYCGWDNLFVSNNLAVGWSSLTALPTTGGIREFAIAPSNNQVIYVLKSNGVFKTTNGGSSWTNVTGALPVASVSPEYICIDPGDANNAWVVFSGYSTGNKVFVTTNGGAGWTNFSANLPNIPVNCITYEPGSNDMLYIGMDVGVYYRDNSMSNWTLYNNNLPNVPISELEISPASPTLLHAATYGRGVWVASLYSPGSPPASSFTITNVSMCVNSAISFSNLSSNSPTANIWSVFPQTGVLLSSSVTANTSITFANPGSYIVSLQSFNAYGNTTYTQAVSILAPPTINIANSTQVICPGSSVTFSAGSAGSFTWSNGGGNSAVASYTPLTASIYTVTSDFSGCVNTATASVSLYALPSVTISGADTICSGDQVLLTASGAISYTWSTGQNFSFITVNPGVTSVYSITALNINNCKGYQTHTITVNHLPQIAINSNDSLICANEEVLLNATGADTYTWLPGNIGGSSVSYTTAATINYTCMGTDANGCINSAELTINVDACEGLSDFLKLNQALYKIYPNPVKNKLTIQCNASGINKVLLEVSDLAGKIIIKQELQFNYPGESTDLNLSNIAPGSYQVCILQGNSRTELLKIMKE